MWSVVGGLTTIIWSVVGFFTAIGRWSVVFQIGGRWFLWSVVGYFLGKWSVVGVTVVGGRWSVVGGWSVGGGFVLRRLRQGVPKEREKKLAHKPTVIGNKNL